MPHTSLLTNAATVLTLVACVPMLVTPAAADPVAAADPNNVALTSAGASFVSASSAYQAPPAGLAMMQINPINPISSS